MSDFSSPPRVGEVETPKTRLEIKPHPLAPRFAAESNPQLVVKQLCDEVETGNFPTTADFREWVRQAGLVSLWFYLKVIAAFSGPYESLNADLHVDMANFYQLVDYPGSKAAAFIGRKHFKSTLFTHGGRQWTILRRPNVTIGIGSGVYDRAVEFMKDIKHVFEGNEFFQWVYPEHAVYRPNAQPMWNEMMLVTPARTRFRDQPTIKPFTVGGSTQSLHFDILHMDDIIGDQQVDAFRHSTTEMHRIKNWLTSSVRTLVADWRRAQIFVVGTRYARDDVYEYIMNSVKNEYGYWQGLAEGAVEDGEWDVYYRKSLEDRGDGRGGQVIFPQRITKEGLDRMQVEDPWTWALQYMNDPSLLASTEMGNYTITECEIIYDPAEGYLVGHRFSAGEKNGWREIPLGFMDVVMGVDPGASEKRTSARTSRSAVVVLATGPDGVQYIIDGYVGIAKATQVSDWMFELVKKYRGNIRMTALESQGAFKIMKDFLRREEELRGVQLNMVPVFATGDKDARIRVALQPAIYNNKIYAIRSMASEINAELKTFPDGWQKDTLDAVAIAMKASHRPPEPEEIEEAMWEEEITAHDRSPVTGY